MTGATIRQMAFAERACPWITGPDTGASSKTIWGVMMCAPVQWPSCPADPSDFGRCFRLLELIPEWRPMLPNVALTYPMWAGMVDAWEELEALWREECGQKTAPKLYKRMLEIRAGKR